MANPKLVAVPTTDAAITVLLTLEKQTKGALRYMEVDGNGNKVEFGEAVIGTQYLRKSAFKDGKFPENITCTIMPR